MEKIKNSIYVETGFPGCNTSFVSTKEGVVVIDTPMVPREARQWRDEALKHGSIRYVINTEPHTDHAAGNCWFEATVVAHEGTRQALLKARDSELTDMLKWMAPDSLPLDTAFHYVYPNITFSQDLTLYLGDHTLQLINLPGHTPSEVAVYVPEEKVVFTGDNMNLAIPIFVESHPYAWLDSLKRIQEMDVDTVVPGHGEVCRKEDIAQMIESIEYWIQSIKAAIDKGMSLDQTLKNVTMAERYPGLAEDPQAGGMMRMSQSNLYRILAKEGQE